MHQKSTFVDQLTIKALKLKKVKETDYILSWKSKGLFNSKLMPLYTAFLSNINLSEYRIRMKLKKEPLSVEQKNYCIH